MRAHYINLCGVITLIPDRGLIGCRYRGSFSDDALGSELEPRSVYKYGFFTSKLKGFP